MLDQFAREWLHLYPTARVLIADRDQLSKARREAGPGKRDGEAYVRNQRLNAPQETQRLELVDRGRRAARTRSAVTSDGELLGWMMSPAGRPR